MDSINERNRALDRFKREPTRIASMLTELPGLSFAEISNTLRMNFHTVKLKGKDTGNTIDCLSVSDKEDTPHRHIDNALADIGSRNVASTFVIDACVPVLRC